MGKDSVIDFISQFGVKPEGRFAECKGTRSRFLDAMLTKSFVTAAQREGSFTQPVMRC
jgi:hypothetical protein